MVLLIIVSVRVHQRPNLAFGISLYVSDDGQPSNVCNTMVRRVPWPGGATGNMNWQFRMILKIILKKEGRERQTSSSKQRLTMVQG